MSNLIITSNVEKEILLLLYEYIYIYTLRCARILAVFEVQSYPADLQLPCKIMMNSFNFAMIVVAPCRQGDFRNGTLSCLRATLFTRKPYP